MEKHLLEDDIIRLADNLLLPLGMLQWSIPTPIKLLQRASVLRLAHKLHLRPYKVGKGEYEISVNFMGQVISGIIHVKTNHWEIEPNGDELSTTLSCHVFGPIELASIGIRQDFLHFEEACKFIWKQFPHCRE